MERMPAVQYLAIGVRCLLVMVFLTAVVGKVAPRGGFGLFVASIRDMRLLPVGLARPTALLVLAAECSVCVLLASPAAGVASIGLGLATLLLIGLTAAVVLVNRRVDAVSCRCFGASSSPLGARHVFRNAFLTVLGAAGVIASRSDGPMDADGVVVAVCAGALLALLIVKLDIFVDLFQTSARPSPGRREGR
ncbi:MauE/DoxX family redox-associated membrane protein [Micromonospora sp. NPDC005174]|uniref:MauE/DoxX family redox-associated membrane protein n=1 Tax=unclassified Micromonospora TaxID=2617518 RepID=UPI0033B1128F